MSCLITAFSLIYGFHPQIKVDLYLRLQTGPPKSSKMLILKDYANNLTTLGILWSESKDPWTNAHNKSINVSKAEKGCP